MTKREASDKLNEVLTLLNQAEAILKEVEDNHHMVAIEEAYMGVDSITGHVAYAIKELEY